MRSLCPGSESAEQSIFIQQFFASLIPAFIQDSYFCSESSRLVPDHPIWKVHILKPLAGSGFCLPKINQPSWYQSAIIRFIIVPLHPSIAMSRSVAGPGLNILLASAADSTQFSSDMSLTVSPRGLLVPYFQTSRIDHIVFLKKI